MLLDIVVLIIPRYPNIPTVGIQYTNCLLSFWMFFVSQVEARFVVEGLCGFDRCLGSGPGASLRPDLARKPAANVVMGEKSMEEM